MLVIDEETWLAMHGASRQNIGESALHKNRGRHSEKTWKKVIEAQAQKDRQLTEKRDELRKDFRARIEAGEIREPTRFELLIKVASGHSDNEAVRAARRILQKNNIPYGETL